MHRGQFGQVTPPQGMEIEAFDDWQCPGGSASTNVTVFTNNWSPNSVYTANTTPPRSPFRIRETGPVLLPKVRSQDQQMETASLRVEPLGDYVNGHSRAVSLPNNGYPMQFGSYLPIRATSRQRSTSPSGYDHISSPASMPSPMDHAYLDHSVSERPSLANMRSVSASNIHSHSRTTSSSSIDASVLSRFGFPTYRHSPGPQAASNAGSAPMSRTPSAMSHLAPIAMPGGQIPSYPVRRRNASPPANPSRLSVEVECDPELDMTTTTMMEYLAEPNPTPTLTQRTVEGLRAQNIHFWYDVRNVRSWSDFNVATIASTPVMMDLLRIPVSVRDLPQPPRVNLIPETPAQLAETCANHYAVKVNAALKNSLGHAYDRHIAIRALKSAPGARQQPEFVSSYQSDAEKTIYGDGRGRVVGIVKCFDQWNSGMRSESPPQQVKYLQSLALLHRYMREHGCRYGFIITEIELICVRAGGAPGRDSTVPLFGFLEVSAPIQLSASGSAEDGGLRMTATLALWWLHMLALNQPLQGQHSWRLDVGGPAAMTRRNHLPRDDWMPKPVTSEKREAKRIRGWVWPDEPLSKRESGRMKRVNVRT